jgi:integrase
MAPRTLADYRSKTRNWIIPLLGKHRLDRLTPEHLDTAYAVMLQRDLSPSTVLKVHRVLSRALRIAVRHGRISRNVATLVDAPSVSAQEIEPLTRWEARRILKVAATRRNAARWSVALALRLRPGEVLGLRWSYVDLKTGVIRAWFQIQHLVWRHGCDNPHACGERWHRRACKKG